MADKEYTPKDVIKWSGILVAIIAAAVGSLGTVSIYLGTPIGQNVARPNPWTSLQATASHKQTDSRLIILEEHVRNHPDRTNQFDRRIAVLESQYSTLLLNQQRILDKLDGR